MTTSYPVTTYTHSPKTVTTTSLPILVAVYNRLSVHMVNTDSQTIYLRVDGGTAVADNTAWPLLPGAELSLHLVPGDNINAIVASGTASIHILTGGA